MGVCRDPASQARDLQLQLTAAQARTQELEAQIEVMRGGLQNVAGQLDAAYERGHGAGWQECAEYHGLPRRRAGAHRAGRHLKLAESVPPAIAGVAAFAGMRLAAAGGAAARHVAVTATTAGLVTATAAGVTAVALTPATGTITVPRPHTATMIQAPPGFGAAPCLSC